LLKGIQRNIFKKSTYCKHLSYVTVLVLLVVLKLFWLFEPVEVSYCVTVSNLPSSRKHKVNKGAAILELNFPSSLAGFGKSFHSNRDKLIAAPPFLGRPAPQVQTTIQSVQVTIFPIRLVTVSRTFGFLLGRHLSKRQSFVDQCIDYVGFVDIERRMRVTFTRGIP